MKRCALLFLFINVFVNIALAQSWITAKDAKNYIGHYKQVRGHYYKRDVRKNKLYPDSIMVLDYMCEPNEKVPDFIVVIKLTTKGDSNEAKYARTCASEAHNALKVRLKRYPGDMIAGEGTIVIFEGKPAIITTFDHMIILEPVD